MLHLAMHADRIFNPAASNRQIFDNVGKDIVRSVVRGYNGTIFAYGQTAAGKTWTMQGMPPVHAATNARGRTHALFGAHACYMAHCVCVCVCACV
ncbi:hypothetical protein EON66_09450 [archaeon]|nr:MAG: hypothetical protein EON66_09450 [archaeon]